MRRSLLVLSAAATAIFLPLMVLVWWNPLNLRHSGVLIPFLTGLAAVSAAAVLALAVRHRAAIVGGVALGLAGVLFAGGLALLAAMFDTRARDVTRVPSPDGRYELVVVEGDALMAIDLVYDVRLRTGHGLLSREVTVWQGYEDGPGPKAVRFVGPRTVEVVTDDGCRYRSIFARWTLRLNPQHSDPPGRAC